MAILKDMSSGFSSKFLGFSINKEIDKSYARIQTIKQKELFLGNLHLLNFQGI